MKKKKEQTVLDEILEPVSVPSKEDALEVKTILAVITGKDNSLYEFNGKKYTKGRLVLEVVFSYLEQTEVKTIAELQEAFPDHLQPRYGIVADIETAKEKSKHYKRYFLKYGEVKATKDGKQFAVCNQWGIGNIQPFIDHAIGMGFAIKAAV